ncbi:MAG: TrmO family methyltransferase domain-containing protein [Anaerolineaceae bacterium]
MAIWLYSFPDKQLTPGCYDALAAANGCHHEEESNAAIWLNPDSIPSNSDCHPVVVATNGHQRDNETDPLAYPSFGNSTRSSLVRLGFAFPPVRRITCPRRPNLTKRLLQVTWLDAHDGTPVLDLKPYIPASNRVQNPHTPDWIAGQNGAKLAILKRVTNHLYSPVPK